MMVHIEREPLHTMITVIGAGTTAMDTCIWLLDAEVDSERIRWIRPRDSWLFEMYTLMS